MGLRILVDTNILLDYLLCREPYDVAAREIVLACKQKKVTGCIAAHSISGLQYGFPSSELILETRKSR